MAEAISINQYICMCPICLDLLTDPVTLNCGHNYCTGCIKGCWDQEDQKGVYSCPQCRQTFTPRPVLNKNNFVAELVEQFRKTLIQGRPTASPQCFAGPGDVECDSCTGRKLKAVKSCLACLLSYCETHLQRHDELFSGKRHNVVDVTGQLQDKICTQHQRLLEVFCRTDQSCVCVLCLVDEHKGHDTVSAAAERTEKQKEMEETKRKLHQRLQEREKELPELRKAVETLKSSAQTAVEDSERIFTEMIRSIERRRSEVTELIRAQEKAEVSQAEGLLKQLEQEIAELRRRDAELEQLSHTDDHIHFLKSVNPQSQSEDSFSTSVSQSWSFEAVKKSVSTLKGQLEDFFKQEVMKISAADSCHFTLDPNTAHRNLHLSEGNRRVESRDELQSYPDHPERFEKRGHVLCREGVSGRCYWEVERSGGGYIAVSYKSISRKGRGAERGFGCNDQSWCLFPYSCSCSFYHNYKETKLPLVASSRIGVYVDHRAGTLAFYSISDTMTLLHRVQTTFTHTLYPGFWIDTGSLVKLL
ncbi:E3 ubiquitin/ISG15 ligase TRIM25-like isoform X2 [Alosa pseudoharengus]|uniref:E3 ubiquitin/ISG15 ligase TRIM25-like isoform X2 n=1 Tax=Alosa pseudoharengus TaxID=34774 RepID=UPI003F88C773